MVYTPYSRIYHNVYFFWIDIGNSNTIILTERRNITLHSYCSVHTKWNNTCPQAIFEREKKTVCFHQPSHRSPIFGPANNTIVKRIKRILKKYLWFHLVIPSREMILKFFERIWSIFVFYCSRCCCMISFLSLVVSSPVPSSLPPIIRIKIILKMI